MKIDLHNHTTLSSTCSVLDVHDLIMVARDLGLDGVCVTEHNTMKGGRIAEKLGKEKGFLVIAGQEVAAAEGDILAFGVYEEGLHGIGMRELGKLASESGGVLVPAHPFRANVHSVGDNLFGPRGLFCAVETLNGNATETENLLAARAAERLSLPCTGGSDAHSAQMVGRYYTVFNDRIDGADSLIAALRSGLFHPAENPLWAGGRKRP